MTSRGLWFVCSCPAGIVSRCRGGATTDTHSHPNYCASYYFFAILHMIPLIWFEIRTRNRIAWLPVSVYTADGSLVMNVPIGNSECLGLLDSQPGRH